MSDLLNNPPAIRKKSPVKPPANSFLLEKSDSSFLSKKKAWKYWVQIEGQETQGFARSRQGALLKIKIWSIRQEARKRRNKKRDIKSLGQKDFLQYVGESFPLHQYKESTLEGQRINQDLFLFSAQSSRPLLDKRPSWVAGVVQLGPEGKSSSKNIVSEEKSRRRAERKALADIRKRIEKRELADLKSSVEIS